MLLTISSCGTMLISETQKRRHALYINTLTIRHIVNTKRFRGLHICFQDDFRNLFRDSASFIILNIIFVTCDFYLIRIFVTINNPD